jgi:multidrug efflux pump
MSFTEIFIRRPVLAMVLSLIVLLVGGRSYFDLTTRLYPKVDASAVTVTVTYSGADAALMEGFVATPIENSIAGVDGIDYITSSSTPGKTVITVYFKLGYDINTAVSDVNSKVSSVRWRLPKDIDDPVIDKKDPNATPALYISFYSKNMTPEQITDYLVRVVQPQMQTLDGVAQAQILGAREYAMRIWLDPKMMAAQEVSTNDIQSALTYNNLQAPAGLLKSEMQTINVKIFSELNSSDQFDNLVLKDIDNHLVRIKDVGHAELGAKNTDFSVNMNGETVVVIGIITAPTANPLEVVETVKKLLPRLEKAMPAGLQTRITWDNSIYIEESIREVKKTIIQSALCVIAVVFAFICSWRMLLIPLVTIPLSLVGVFGIMLIFGYSLNTITFLSLVLAIGMVVDDAIVVSENIHRHIMLGKSPREASIIGAREIQFAIISMTFTLAAVYAPIGFLTGLVGSLFKEFAFTLAGSVVISGFIALTLSPMMCSKLIAANVLDGRLAQFTHHKFEKLMHGYRRTLEKTLQHRKSIIAIVIAILTISFFLYKAIPSELAPREDTGGIMTVVTAPTSANIAYTEKYTQYLADVYKTIPERTDYLIVNGYQGVNTAISFLVLKPWAQRKRDSNAIIKDLFPKLWKIAGITAFPVNPSMLPGASGNMPISLAIESTGDYDELNQIMNKLLAAARANPGIVNVDTDLKMDQAQVNIKIDRNKAGDMGIAISDIGIAVNIALGEPTINRFSILGRSYDVIPQLEAQYRRQPETLNLLYLRTKYGDIVPLSNLVDIQETLQPQSLNHFQQLRSATLTASVRPGYTLGQAFQYLKAACDKIVPSTMQINYGGELRQFVQTGGTMESTFLFALIFIFLVLAAQFESFRDPLIVLFSVPLSVFGALLALKLTGSTMNIFSQIGVVTLIGLISKHGILMVEFANQLRDEGKNIHDAIVEAASVRLRPVLMTTAAMILGAFPLALAKGAGAISRQQIGWVIIGGMTIGTIFTLFVVPTIYTYLAGRREAASTLSSDAEKSADKSA